MQYLQQKEVGSVSEARLITNEAFKNLVTAILALDEANELSATPDTVLRGKYEKIIFSINSSILHTKNTVSHLKGHEKDEPEGGGGGGIG